MAQGAEERADLPLGRWRSRVCGQARDLHCRIEKHRDPPDESYNKNPNT